MKNLVLYGGCMNPPTDAHVANARMLAGNFDRTVVVVCGIREAKPTTTAVDPLHRAIMARKAFGNTGAELDLTDLDRPTFTTTVELDRAWKERLGNGWTVWHAVGSELVASGASHQADIQSWHDGERAWSQLNFAVLPRPGFRIAKEDLPPNHLVMPNLGHTESSTMARTAYSSGNFGTAGVHKEVAEHVQRYGLYTWAPGPRRQGILTLSEKSRLAVVHDPHNPKARAYAGLMPEPRVPAENADAVVVIGGDGHMLDTIRAIRPCVPIIGINAGNLGMLLNDAHPTAIRTMVSEGTPFDIHLLPLLEIEIMGLDGKWRPEKYYAFNDVTFGRGFGTRADKIRVEVRGRRPRTIPEVVCDGIVVASPAGSHAYAYALKAPGQLLETPVLTIVPCAPFRPREWQYSTVTDDHEVILTAIDPHIRPARAVVDSLSLGDCLAIRVRMSRSEGVELAFIRGCSLADKIADRQFPFTFC